MLLRRCFNGTAGVLACFAFAAVAGAQDLDEPQSCDRTPRTAASGETAFVAVGDIQRLGGAGERTSVSDDTLRAAAAPWSGAPLNIATVRCAGLAMERAFRDAGYPYTRVTAPPQKVEGGRVTYQVVEGWVERVTPVGESATARLQAHRRLRSLETASDPEPLSRRSLERAAALLDDSPGLVSRLAISRGQEDRPGALRIIAEVEPEPRELVLNVNNYGAKVLGRSGASLLYSMPGRAPLGDEFTASLYSTFDVEEQRALRLAYRRGLTANGLEATATVAYGEAEPGGDVRVLGAAADSLSWTVSLTQPIYANRETRVRVRAGLGGADQNGELFGGTVSLSEDATRNLFAAVEAEAAPGCDRLMAAPMGACWRLAGALEVRQGIEGLGGSEKGDARLARPFANPSATVFRASADVQTPRGPAGLRARVSFSGQSAQDPLMAFDEFNIGNYTMVRGYDPGAVAGDSGVAGSIEIMGPAFQVKGVDIEPFGFYDAGRLWNEDPGAPSGRFVSSAGAGVRLTLNRRFRMDATWARPTHPPLGLGEPEPSSRVLFSVSTKLSGLFGRDA